MQARRWSLQRIGAARSRRGERPGWGSCDVGMAAAAAAAAAEEAAACRLGAAHSQPLDPPATPVALTCGAMHLIRSSSPPLLQAAGRPYRRRQAGSRPDHAGAAGQHPQRHASEGQRQLAAASAGGSRRRRAGGSTCSPGVHVCGRHDPGERCRLCRADAHSAAHCRGRCCCGSHRRSGRGWRAEHQRTGGCRPQHHRHPK